MGVGKRPAVQGSVDEYFRHVLACCMRRIPADDAYDAANEVFTVAWRRIGDVPGGDAARRGSTWWLVESSTGGGGATNGSGT